MDNWPEMLQIEQLQFAYSDNQPLFSGLDLQLQSGQLVGLIGANGAGKSTLLRLMLGLEPGGKRHGRILWQGEEVSALSRRQLARLCAWVPQDTQLPFAFSVRQLVAMGRNPWIGRLQALTATDQQIIDQAMAQTDVLALAERPLTQLSGGERQRVLIARAIAQQTPVIILDEATASLDVCHQLEILNLAKELADNGRLVICAIHDLNLAARYCQQLVLLAEGDIQAKGTAREVLTVENLQRYFHFYARTHADTHHQNQHTFRVEALAPVRR